MWLLNTHRHGESLSPHPSFYLGHPPSKQAGFSGIPTTPTSPGLGQDRGGRTPRGKPGCLPLPSLRGCLLPSPGFHGPVYWLPQQLKPNDKVGPQSYSNSGDSYVTAQKGLGSERFLYPRELHFSTIIIPWAGCSAPQRHFPFGAGKFFPPALIFIVT